MAITPKEKELVAVGISVAAGCKPCTDYHVTVARKARAADDEIRQAVATALAVRRRAAEIMEAHASTHFGEDWPLSAQNLIIESTRITELVSVGAAFVVNCVSSLEKHLGAAKATGISEEEITQIVKLAVLIKERAASHVERLAGMAREEAA